MRGELFEKGLQIRRELFGAELGGFQDIVTRYCFGEVWGNEDLVSWPRFFLKMA